MPAFEILINFFTCRLIYVANLQALDYRDITISNLEMIMSDFCQY